MATKTKFEITDSPSSSWIKSGKGKDGNDFQFIPIDIIENTLDKIYKTWATDITHMEVYQGQVVIAIKLTVIDGTIARTMAGVGGHKSSNIETSVAIAKSLALKNAAKELGNIFGRALNRDYYVDLEAGKVKKTPNLPKQ